MPGIGIGVSKYLRKSSIFWSSYWTTLISATVEDAAPTHVILTFPEAQDSLIDTDFTVTVNGGAVAVSSDSWAGAVLTLVLASACVYGDVVVVTFVKSGGTANVTNNISAEAELTTYITGLTTTLSSAQLKKINDFILTRKSGWTVADLDDVDDVEYILAGETAESSLKNLVKNAHHAVAVNAPTFTAFEGFNGDGISSYINLNYNIFTEGDNYVQNSATIGCYSRTNSNEAAVDLGSRSNAADNRANLILRSSDLFYIRINTNGTSFGTAANMDSRGMYYGSRTASNVHKGFKNKTEVITDTKTSVYNYSNNCFACCTNDGGSPTAFTTRQYAFISFGKGYSQAMVDTGTDSIEAYMDSLGKGVIP